MNLFAASLSLSTLICLGTFDALADCPPPPVLTACKGCHSFEPGERSWTKGSNLVGVAGQPAMHAADFEYYSPSLKAAQANELTWTDENLMAYLSNPKTFLNEFNGRELRSAMSFQMKDEAQHRVAIEGLETISGCQ